MKRVMITGVYGLVGNVAYTRLAREADVYEVHGMTRRRQHSDRIGDEQVMYLPADRLHVVDLADFAAVHHALEGMDVVVHMAADPSGERGWESLHSSNVVGAYNVFEASRLAGVKRVLFASSMQVVFGYREHEPYASLFARREDRVSRPVPTIKPDWPGRPLGLYACTKVWGEALSHLYAYAHGMSCINLRLGWVVREDRPRRGCIFDWCSQRDCADMIKRCIDAPDSLRYDTFYAISANDYRWVDIDHAREVLGFVPRDRAEDHGDY